MSTGHSREVSGRSDEVFGHSREVCGHSDEVFGHSDEVSDSETRTVTGLQKMKKALYYIIRINTFNTY